MNERIESFKEKYDFLSNFYPCKIVYDGKEYPSSEHLFQSMKFWNPVDKEMIEKVRTCKSAFSAKGLGKSKKINKNWWDHVKVSAMMMVVDSKFSQNPDLLQKLLDTGDVELIEGNWWRDDFWGVYNGVGENYLGKILMKVREKYKDKK